MKQMEKQNEREAFQMARKLSMYTLNKNNFLFGCIPLINADIQLYYIYTGLQMYVCLKITSEFILVIF